MIRFRGQIILHLGKIGIVPFTKTFVNNCLPKTDRKIVLVKKLGIDNKFRIIFRPLSCKFSSGPAQVVTSAVLVQLQGSSHLLGRRFPACFVLKFAL